MKTILQELHSHANPEIAAHSTRFFKTAPGEYGAGDKFLGIRVPQLRQIAKKHIDLPLPTTIKLLNNPYHEIRLTALLLLTYKYQHAGKKKTNNPALQQEIYDLYLANRRFINNWDLVDTTAPKIIGAHLLTRPQERTILYDLAQSTNLWDRRIAILATYTFIKSGEFTDTLKLAKILLNDPHDLIHKAVGWMLREMGKVDQPTLENFLNQHHQKMPRTMLRYAIEKLPNFILSRAA